MGICVNIYILGQILYIPWLIQQTVMGQRLRNSCQIIFNRKTREKTTNKAQYTSIIDGKNFRYFARLSRYYLS
jgi:hypothetical protein